MFKLNSKSFNEPVKQNYIAEEHFDQGFGEEGGAIIQSDTLILAQFLSSTGPEEFSNNNNNISNIKKIKKASRILSRLRKQPTITALGSKPAMEESKKHIPLKVNYESPLDISASTISTVSSSINSESAESEPVIATSSPSRVSATALNNENNNFYNYSSYYKNCNNNSNMHQVGSVVSSTMRDSGIYSETMSTSEKPSCMTISDFSFPHPPPCRPEPLPAAVASAAIATACQSSAIISPRSLRSVPEAALKRKSIRLRHIQIQTEHIKQGQDEPLGDKRSCHHCRQIISLSKRQRRSSCPPALASGPTQDTRQLYDLIHSLKSQLDQERKYRQELEKRVDQHHLTNKKEALLKERSKWEGDCAWMNNRMALISE